MLEPPRDTNAFGRSAPSREPEPAATTMTPTVAVDVMGWLGSQYLVENRRGLFFVRLLGEREFGDQDLTGLGQHALLAC